MGTFLALFSARSLQLKINSGKPEKIARPTISAEITQFRTKGKATVILYFNARQKFVRQKTPQMVIVFNVCPL